MNTVKILFLSILAYVIATAVVLSSLHVRDIVGHNNTIGSADAMRTVKAHVDDPSAKAIGDLHNHVEKTMVKSLMKAMNDPATLARSRQTVEDVSDTEQSFTVRLMQMVLMFRLTYAFTLAR